jgi:hypothetical protein
MSTFSEQLGDAVIGELTMFDRMVFKGHLTSFFPPGAFQRFLSKEGVLLKHFGEYVEGATDELKAHAKKVAAEARRPYIYLSGSYTAATGRPKDEIAKKLIEEDRLTDGLVCVLAAVEPCYSFLVKGNAATHKLEVVRAARKCLHFYFYYLDRELGLIHVRLQSWFPFGIQVWMNGREWLARQIKTRGISFERYDNSLTRIGDLKLAQSLCDKFAHREWPRVLDALAARVNPWLKRIGLRGFGSYYWVLDQFEIATDVMFKDRRTLEKLAPDLYEHAILEFGSQDVMRFLGKKPHASFQGELVSDLKRRPEGWRIKHRIKGNSIKMYDKWSVLRIETTINNPREFKILKAIEGKWRWVPMGKGVANMWGYYQVGIAANKRYLTALAKVQPKGKAIDELDDLCRTRTIKGKHCPRLIPIHVQTVALFTAVLAGENAINGFRNSTLARHLFPAKATPQEANRRCAWISRRISTLRARGLVAKLPNSHRYRVTEKGALVMGAAIRIRKNDFPAEFRKAA